LGKNAGGLQLSGFSKYYLVAMATSLDKSENKVQFDHPHLKRFYTVKKNALIGVLYPEIFN